MSGKVNFFYLPVYHVTMILDLITWRVFDSFVVVVNATMLLEMVRIRKIFWIKPCDDFLVSNQDLQYHVVPIVNVN